MKKGSIRHTGLWTKVASRAVYTDIAKTRDLVNNRIKDPKLEMVTTTLQLRMNEVPCTLTFDQAILNYRTRIQQTNNGNKAVPFREHRQVKQSVSNRKDNLKGDSGGIWKFNPTNSSSQTLVPLKRTLMEINLSVTLGSATQPTNGLRFQRISRQE